MDAGDVVVVEFFGITFATRSYVILRFLEDCRLVLIPGVAVKLIMGEGLFLYFILSLFLYVKQFSYFFVYRVLQKQSTRFSNVPAPLKTTQATHTND